MARAEKLLWYLNFLVTLALLARILYCKLQRTYPALFLYWLSQVVDIILFQIPMQSRFYANVYYTAQVVNLGLSILVVQMLYRVALIGHPALSAFGRRSMLAVLGMAAIFALAGASVDSTMLPGQYWNIPLLSGYRILTLG
ncbi:MAG: hypothetical protein EXQ47_11665 [Bryobacterales bacterium]|nr:hypothetical protein [Bryobacterales bacterium]